MGSDHHLTESILSRSELQTHSAMRLRDHRLLLASNGSHGVPWGPMVYDRLEYLTSVRFCGEE